MAISCDSSVLTGADGLVEFAPAGVSACVLAADITTTGIDVGVGKRFVIDDPISIAYPQGSTADSTLPAGDYFVQDYSAAGILNVATTKGGAAVAPTGDASGLGSGHVDITYTGTVPVCNVQEWSLDLTSDTVDTTVLPCSLGTGGSKVAPVRTNQKTYLNGEGSMSMLFTGDLSSIGNRLLADAVMSDSKVKAKLYINAVAGAGATVDDAASMYFEGKVHLLGFSVTANTSDALTAEVTFSLAEQPTKIFGVTV